MDESDRQEPVPPCDVPDTADLCEHPVVAEYRRRFAYLLDSFSFWCAVRNANPTFNNSLTLVSRSLDARPPSKPRRTRLNVELELLITHRATQLAVERGSNSSLPTDQDVTKASAEVIAMSKPRRGRPADPILAHHVHGFMALYRWATGNDLCAGLNRNGENDPHIKSAMQDSIVQLLRGTNPRITVGSIADIIVKARRSRVIDGKVFCDFFPFYGGHVDSVTGEPVPGPGFRLEGFNPAAPIFIS